MRGGWAREGSRWSIRSSRSWLAAAVSRRDWVSPRRAWRPRREVRRAPGRSRVRPRRPRAPTPQPQKERVAGGAGQVVAERREGVGERMPAAVIGQDAGHAGGHRRDQDDEPDDYDHDVLRGSALLTYAGRPWRPPPRRFRVAGF